MTSETTRDVVKKIAKLLTLAEGQGTTAEEAASAASMAHRLMLRHRIEREDVAKIEDEDQDTIAQADTLVEGDDRWERELLSSIGRANSCVVVRYPDGRSRFVGHRSDIEISHYLWDHLRREVDRLTRQNCRGWDRPARKSFRLGVVHTVRWMLTKGTEGLKTAKGVTGLEIIQSRKGEVDAWVEANMSLRSGRKLRTLALDPDAYGEGKAAGATIQLRKGLEAPDPNAPLPAPSLPPCVEGLAHELSPWFWTGQNYERECSRLGCTHKETAGKVVPVGMLKSADGLVHEHDWDVWRSTAGALRYRRRCRACPAHVLTEDLSA